MSEHPLARYRREWDVMGRGQRSRVVCAQLIQLEPSVSALAPTDLGVLVDVLVAREGRCCDAAGQRSNEVISAMVRRFDLDQLVGLATLRALLPGLAGVGRALHWGAGGPWSDAEEFSIDLLTTAWRHLKEHGGESLERPARIVVGQVRRTLRTDRERHWREAARSSSALPVAVLARDDVDELTSLAQGLVSLAGTVLDRRDAALLLLNRVFGYQIAEISAASGTGIAQLNYRRRRAEAAICR